MATIHFNNTDITRSNSDLVDKLKMFKNDLILSIIDY